MKNWRELLPIHAQFDPQLVIGLRLLMGASMTEAAGCSVVRFKEGDEEEEEPEIPTEIMDQMLLLSGGLWDAAGTVRGGEARERFLSGMIDTLRVQLNQAFTAGMASVGLSASDVTYSERQAIEMFIAKQLPFVRAMGTEIIQNRLSSLMGGSGSLESITARADIWNNLYREAYNLGVVLGAKDQKLTWRLGPTEHCRSCLHYSGKVYRASLWMKYGAMPQSRELACGGYRCQCRLVPTNDPATPGVPATPGSI